MIPHNFTNIDWAAAEPSAQKSDVIFVDVRDRPLRDLRRLRHWRDPNRATWLIVVTESDYGCDAIDMVHSIGWYGHAYFDGPRVSVGVAVSDLRHIPPYRGIHRCHPLNTAAAPRKTDLDLRDCLDLACEFSLFDGSSWTVMCGDSELKAEADLSSPPILMALRALGIAYHVIAPDAAMRVRYAEEAPNRTEARDARRWATGILERPLPKSDPKLGKAASDAAWCTAVEARAYAECAIDWADALDTPRKRARTKLAR